MAYDVIHFALLAEVNTERGLSDLVSCRSLRNAFFSSASIRNVYKSGISSGASNTSCYLSKLPSAMDTGRSLQRMDPRPLAKHPKSVYQLLFTMRFDVPFPFYDDELVETKRGTKESLGDGFGESTCGSEETWIQRAGSSPPSDMEIVRKKVGTLRGHESAEPKKGDASGTMKSPKQGDKSIRRREAVFDHHEVHPDWEAKEEEESALEMEQNFQRGSDGKEEKFSTPKSRGHQYHSMKLRETKNRGDTGQSAKESGDHALDRDRSVSVMDRRPSHAKVEQKQPTVGGASDQRQSGTSEGKCVMSELNQKRTDRLSKALKALEKKHQADSEFVSRSQSMKTSGSRARAKPASQNTHSDCVNKSQRSNGSSSPEAPTPDVFRRRTSSVPVYCEDGKRASNHLKPSASPEKERPLDNAAINATDESGSYERMRTFVIDPEKGTLVNRGDSFRRRCNTGLVSPRGIQTKENGYNRCNSPAAGIHSLNSSNFSSRSHSPIPQQAVYFSPLEPLSPTIQCSGLVRHYCIVVLGLEGVGKTSMINQFMTSEYCNPFQTESSAKKESAENSVAVILNGEESQLTFVEADNRKNDLSLTLSGAGYVIVYAVDDTASFENANQVLFQLRLQAHSADKPIILVGNKVDLERKRLVSSEEGKSAAKENQCKFVEIAVALGHHVDELLAGILAQVRHHDKERQAIAESQNLAKSTDELVFDSGPCSDLRVLSSAPSSRSSSDSTPTRTGRPGGAVKRSSTKRDKEYKWKTAAKSKDATTSCSNLTAVSHRLAGKVFGRRRGSRSVEDLLSIRK